MRQLDIYLLASQATLQSYDMAGHYPDLLDIPNRDLQTSPTTTAATSFSQKVMVIRFFTNVPVHCSGCCTNLVSNIQIMDVSTIRLSGQQPQPPPQSSDLICTCPHPAAPAAGGQPVSAAPAVISPDSFAAAVATAAILPPPPSFLSSEISATNVQTVPINKVVQLLTPDH